MLSDSSSLPVILVLLLGALGLLTSAGPDQKEDPQPPPSLVIGFSSASGCRALTDSNKKHSAEELAERARRHQKPVEIGAFERHDLPTWEEMDKQQRRMYRKIWSGGLRDAAKLVLCAEHKDIDTSQLGVSELVDRVGTRSGKFLSAKIDEVTERLKNPYTGETLKIHANDHSDGDAYIDLLSPSQVEEFNHESDLLTDFDSAAFIRFYGPDGVIHEEIIGQSGGSDGVAQNLEDPAYNDFDGIEFHPTPGRKLMDIEEKGLLDAWRGGRTTRGERRTGLEELAIKFFNFAISQGVDPRGKTTKTILSELGLSRDELEESRPLLGHMTNPARGSLLEINSKSVSAGSAYLELLNQEQYSEFLKANPSEDAIERGQVFFVRFYGTHRILYEAVITKPISRGQQHGMGIPSEFLTVR